MSGPQRIAYTMFALYFQTIFRVPHSDYINHTGYWSADRSRKLLLLLYYRPFWLRGHPVLRDPVPGCPKTSKRPIGNYLGMLLASSEPTYPHRWVPFHNTPAKPGQPRVSIQINPHVSRVTLILHICSRLDQSRTGRRNPPLNFQEWYQWKF
jgi:hypothetical protein